MTSSLSAQKLGRSAPACLLRDQARPLIPQEND